MFVMAIAVVAHDGSWFILSKIARAAAAFGTPGVTSIWCTVPYGRDAGRAERSRGASNLGEDEPRPVMGDDRYRHHEHGIAELPGHLRRLAAVEPDGLPQVVSQPYGRCFRGAQEGAAE